MASLMNTHRFFSSVLFFAAVAANSGLSHAQEEPAAPEASAAASCAEAYEKAQTDRLAGEYLAALEAARSCSQLECNAAIIRECMKLYESLDAEVPTLVLAAKGADGSELTNVRVTADGQPLLDSLDGKPVSLNPRAYVFRFEAEGLPPVEVQQTARVGEKHRIVEVVLATPEQLAAAAAATSATTSPQAPPRPVIVRRKRPVPLATYLLGGTGVVALGAFGYLRVSGIADYNEMNADCSPTCSPDDVDPIRSKFRLSFVALGVGAAALSGAAALYIFRGEENVPAAEVGLSTGFGVAGAHLKTRF